MRAVLGVDVGTSSTKGVLVSADGTILRTAVREHAVSRPHPGWAEMPAELWWQEFQSITRELLAGSDHEVTAVGVSGMGPCVAITDAENRPLRPAILYGVDSRATREIAELTERLGADAVLERCGSLLSTQAVGPKLAWLAANEPEHFALARRIYMPASWLGWNLTGAYVLDHQSASQSVPLYDVEALAWHHPWADPLLGGIELPELVWADTVIGEVTRAAAEATGLRLGTPVIAGSIDAWMEAVSVGAHSRGDLMLMYGTTMFLVNTLDCDLRSPSLWSTIGALPGTRTLAAGMATSGAITAWLRDLTGGPDYGQLIAEAESSGPGARGLLMLPYFAGERTPIADPGARGVIAGLTVEHTRGDLYRATLEATAFATRHNIDAIRDVGGTIDRVVAVGGGTQGALWTQVVSDITGLEQVIPRVTVGASFGAAFLAARSSAPVNISEWNPPAALVEPRREHEPRYERLYELYRSLYPATRDIVHELAAHS